MILKMERSYRNVFFILTWSAIGMMVISYFMTRQIFTLLGEYAIIQLVLSPIASSFLSKSPVNENAQRSS